MAAAEPPSAFKNVNATSVRRKRRRNKYV